MLAYKILRNVLFGLLIFTDTVFASPVAINSTEARDWTNHKGQELISTLGESNLTLKYAKLDKMMTEDVNLNYISKFVIGKYGKLMTPEQKNRYEDLFNRYVLSLYKQFNLDYDTNNINFSIDNVIEYPRFTTVNCTIDPGKIFNNTEVKKIPIKFKLIRGTNNQIQAVDLEIAEVSLVIEYRKRFYQMIKDEEEDIEWFLDKFADKVKANEKKIQIAAEI